MHSRDDSKYDSWDDSCTFERMQCRSSHGRQHTWRAMVASAPTLLVFRVDDSSRLRPVHVSQLSCHKRSTPTATSPGAFGGSASFAHHTASKRRLTPEIGMSHGSLRKKAASRPALRHTWTTSPRLSDRPYSLVFDVLQHFLLEGFGCLGLASRSASTARPSSARQRSQGCTAVQRRQRSSRAASSASFCA